MMEGWQFFLDGGEKGQGFKVHRDEKDGRTYKGVTQEGRRAGVGESRRKGFSSSWKQRTQSTKAWGQLLLQHEDGQARP